MQEQEFFNSPNVYVSLTRFVVFDQTYAMSGVTSVKTSATEPSRTWPVVLGLIGVLCFLAGSGGIVWGLMMLALAAGIWVKQKPEYFVVLNSSSGEARALKSHDREFIGGVVKALNECIVARG